ncbi:MAG: putative HNHc nuclease [Ruminococcus sp.]|nr:putative HNHc nuclease [Ruminococcus sp.]
MYEVGEIKGYQSGPGHTSLQIDIPGGDKAALIRKKEIARVGIWLDDGRVISAEQRKKIYASIRDFAEYTGYTPEEAKEVLKYLYVERTGRPYFSLADCSMDTAGEFMDIIIDVCLENGVILTDTLYDRAEDIDRMLYSCLKNRKCAICGRVGETHHWDAIGMGNDRRHYDDSGNRKICLCRYHHTQAHSLGRERFMQIYHVYGIYYDKDSEGIFINENERKGEDEDDRH